MATKEEAAALEDVLTCMKWGGQPFPGRHATLFAKKFAKVHTAKYAQCVNTGTVVFRTTKN
jgi:dTDP-4-amino-4,6-dideoxygalactose transaminase